MPKSLVRIASIILMIFALLALSLIFYATLAPAVLENVTPSPAPTVPILKWEGSGGKVISFNVSGYQAIRVGSGHRGEGNFIVRVFDSSGNFEGGAANCIGDCEDESIVRLSGAGQYYFEVSARGDWFVIAMPLE